VESSKEKQIIFLLDGPLDGFIDNVISEIEVFSHSSEEVRDTIGMSLVRSASGAIAFIKYEKINPEDKLNQNHYNIIISLINQYESHLKNQRNLVEYLKKGTQGYNEILEALYEFKKIVVNYLAP
jgi:hypothetical protein